MASCSGARLLCASVAWYRVIIVLRTSPFFLVISSALWVAGCSIHPIPDDVSVYDTADIVRNVRCEAKSAVRERIRHALHRHPELADIPPDYVTQPRYFSRIKRVDHVLAAKFEDYMGSAIAYDFEFKITEANNASASVGFLVPFFSTGKLAADAGAGLEKSRTGERRFKTVETFAELVKLDCDDYEQPRKNILYPMTGSIGMAKIMNTFIDLTELGGGKDIFTDTITFVTKVSGEAGTVVELLPVTNQFRVVGAEGHVDASRNDEHKLIVSLTFPTGDFRVARLDARAGITNSQIRALENLCIARAEQREDENGTLRFYPPEVYCRRRENVASDLDRLVE